MIVATAIPQIETGTQIFELRLDGCKRGPLALAKASIIPAVILADVSPQALTEHRHQSLPGVLLPGDVATVLKSVRKIERPQVGDALRRGGMKLLPDLVP